MNNILAIAKNSFKETIRDRILYVIVIFAALMIVASLLAGSISMEQDAKVVQDFGLSSIFLFSILMAVFIGTNLVHKEIDKRTIFLIFSKPIKKSQFILGKFAGLGATMAVILAFMALVFMILVRIKTGSFHPLLLEAILLNYFEVLFIIALTIVFSSFTAPLASAVYTILFFLVGHSATTVKTIASTADPFLKYVLQAVYYIFPNLEKFNIRNTVTYNIGFTVPQIGWNILYAAVYIALLLYLANLILRRQEY